MKLTSPIMNHSFPRRSAFAAMALIACMLVFGHAPTALAADDVVTKTVSAPFDKVEAGLAREVAAHNLVVVQKIPHQQMLGMAGVKAPPMIGFEIFHPRYGKVIYEKDPAALKDVPLRIVVQESGGKVILSYRKPSAVFAPYPSLSDLGKELDQVFADIVAKAGT